MLGATEIAFCENISTDPYTDKKNVETTFTQKLQVSFINNYKETARNTMLFN